MNRSLRYLPLIICLLPLLAGNLAWLMSTTYGTIVACVPYWDGCVSISGAARQTPTIYWFRGIMIPNALLTALFWVLCWRWLKELDVASRFQRGVMLFLGLVGSVALIVYALALGTDGDFYRMMRRYGINYYFGMTYLAQITLAGRLLKTSEVPAWIAKTMVGICVATLLLGLASIPTKEWVLDRRAIGNVFEWNLSVLMVLFYAFAYVGWRRMGFPDGGKRP